MHKVFKDIPVGFHRVNKMPLDDSLVLGGNSQLFDYIESGAVYDGQQAVVKYDNYEQPIIFKKGNGDTIIPIMSLPSGIELITKVYNNSRYALVYYHNSNTVYADKKQIVKLDDPFAWALLPQASLLANTDTSISYLLEADNSKYEFTQRNFVTNETLVTTNNTPFILSVANYRAFYPTTISDVVIMPTIESNKIVKLWVKCDEYYIAMGE